MIIEGNQKELDAMKEFHKGNRQEGLRLQEELAAEFREEYKDKDHCPCRKACRYHGNCMRPLINRKIRILSELTEHSVASEIEPPKEVLRKDMEKR